MNIYRIGWREFEEYLYRYQCHHPHHHRRPSAPVISSINIDFKETHMATVAGVNTPTITITLTLPTTRVDGTALSLSEIASATVLRDSGSGPAPLSTTNGPFSSGTVVLNDPAPATGSDIYSFFVTDTAGTIGATSAPVTITVTGTPVLAQPSAGTLTAVASDPNAPPVATASAARRGNLSA